MDRMDFGVNKKMTDSLTSKVNGVTPASEVSKDSHKIQGDNTLNSDNKLNNLEHKLSITNNIKSSKDLRNVVIFGDKNERAEKEFKSIAATTLKAISSAIDPTLGALEHIAKHDILSKLRNIKAAQ